MNTTFPPFRRRVCLAVAFLLLAGTCLTSPTRAADDAASPTRTAVYPMPEVLTQGTSAQGHGFGRSMPRPEQVVKLLELHLSYAGVSGTVQMLGDRLVVVGSEAAHSQVESFLRTLRDEPRQERSSKPVVRVQAVWAPLTGEALAALAGEEPVADWAALSQLGVDLTYRVEVFCRDGDSRTARAGTERNYVSDVTPIVASGSVGYDLTMGSVHDGLTLTVEPMMAGDDRVALRVDAELSRVTEIVAGGTGKPDRVSRRVFELSADLDLTPGRWTPAGAATIGEGDDAVTLHLLVRVAGD